MPLINKSNKIVFKNILTLEHQHYTANVFYGVH